MKKSEKDILNCLNVCEKGDTCIGCPLNSLNSPECVSIMAREAKQLIEENQKRITELEQRLEKSVELPCKIGDTVYVLIQRNVTTEIVKGTVKNVQHSYNAWWVEFSDLWVDKMFDDFGKTVFLTKEEAEQKIQKNQIINCYGCKYWEEFNEVCCNDKSKYCADFVNCGCEHKEINK